MGEGAMKDAIRLEAQRRWRQRVGLIIFTAGLALLCFPLVALDEVGPEWKPGLYAVMGVGLVITLAGFAGAVRYMANANTERVAHREGYRDRVQREHARYIGFLPVGGLLMNFLSLRATWDVLSGAAEFHDWGFAAASPIVSLLILQVVAGLGQGQERRIKRLLDDELIVSFRHRALALALGVAAAGLVVGIGAGLHDPAWGVMAMPITLALAAATAAFRFAHLNRQADPSG